MKCGQSQPPIWCTLDCKTTKLWWLVNMEYKHSKLWLLCFVVVWCFCPHKCTSLIIFGQAVCPNILKCQLNCTYRLYMVMANEWNSRGAFNLHIRSKISTLEMPMKPRALLWDGPNDKNHNSFNTCLTLNYLSTPSFPKWLSSFMILARLRPAQHCPSSCKYDAQK